MGPWAQCPSERPVRFVVPPLGLLGWRCLEGGVDGVSLVVARTAPASEDGVQLGGVK